MDSNKTVKHYSALEEGINITSHAIGFLAAIVGLVLLVVKSSLHGTVWHVVSFSIYGASMVILFAASTVYHSAKNPTVRQRLKVFDHAAIYVLIAGTYTPFCLVTLNGVIGWTLFGIAWGLAIVGIVLKLFFTGRFELISTAAYVIMGWLIVFAIKPLSQSLPVEGLFWLIAGGVAYTFGAILYAIPKIKLNHAIFHIFVLIGSFCHFIAVYYYVI